MNRSDVTALIPDLIKKVVLKGLGVPNVFEGGWKNRAKMRKMPNFPEAGRGTFRFIPNTLEQPFKLF